jgi:hypothetical protein
MPWHQPPGISWHGTPLGTIIDVFIIIMTSDVVIITAAHFIMAMAAIFVGIDIAVFIVIIANIMLIEDGSNVAVVVNFSNNTSITTAIVMSNSEITCVHGFREALTTGQALRWPHRMNSIVF